MSSYICTICARSGSKGIKDKNVRNLAGKPLLVHSIDVAKESGVFDEIVVTSDSIKYLEIAKNYGVNILVQRPSELSVDNVSKLGAIEHAVRQAEAIKGAHYEFVVDLDVTSPLRSVDDVKGAVLLSKSKNVSSIITGTPAHRSPYTNLVELNDAGQVRLCKPTYKNISRRQESPLCFDMNASIYIWKRELLANNPKVFYDDTLLYEMPLERSWDIDSEIDFEIVEFLIQRKSLNKSIYNVIEK
jgi:CMP-N,N'-diacetyllegionaminic acid synthase